MKKEKVLITALAVVQNYLNLRQNMKAAQVGHLFMMLYLVYLKLKQIFILVIQELNITVRNVAVIMDIYLKMDQNPQVKDIVIMEYVYFLKLKINNDKYFSIFLL